MEDVSTQHLTVRVFDDEGVGSSQLIGAAQVPLNELEPGKVKDIWLKLVKDLVVQRDTKNRGQVSIYIHSSYCYNLQVIMKQSRLSITVDKWINRLSFETNFL